MIINKPHPGSSKKAPEFEYSGRYELIDDGKGNWLIRLLSSGRLTIKKVNSGKSADACGVGGGGSGNRWASRGRGGGGAGSGYVKNVFGVKLEAKVYDVTIGKGGLCDVNGNNGDGGATSISGILSAPGGKQGGKGVDGGVGGDGGSGGGGAGGNQGGAGGANGGDGEYGDAPGGNGSGKTTRPFGDSSFAPLAHGGRGAAFKGGNGAPGAANTGNGGDGSGTGASVLFAPGGTGVAMIRPHKKG